MRFVAIFFLLFPIIFLSIGSGVAIHQHRKLAMYSPVEAIVLDTEVERRRSSGTNGGGTTYKPVVHYEYTYDGERYSASEVHPISVSSGSSWAHSIVSQFPEGDVVTAWINPANPSDAYLLHDATFFPYIFILFPMLFVAVGAWLYASKVYPGRRPPTPSPASDGYFRLAPGLGLTKRCRLAVLGTTGWYLVGALVALHYRMVGGSFDLLPNGALGAYSALGVVGIVVSARYGRTRQRVGDALVMIDTRHVQPGQTIRVIAQQPVRRDVEIENMDIDLICELTEKISRGDSTSYEQRVTHRDSETVAETQRLSAGDRLFFRRNVTVPADAGASKFKGAYPRCRWFIELHTRLRGAPDYSGRFPVVVEPGGGATRINKE